MDTRATKTRHGAGIVALASSSFVFVTGEILPVGLLPNIARELAVSEATVGLLLTSYALVVAVGALPLTAMTAQCPRRRLIVVLVGVFALSQGAAALAPTIVVLAVARVAAALAHGVFWSVVSPVAARLSPPGEAGRAASLVLVGGAVASIAGVPLAVLLGQAMGWRAAFAAVALTSVISAFLLLVLLPPMRQRVTDSPATAAGVRDVLRVIGHRDVTIVVAVCMLVVTGQLTVYTYIAPLVQLDSSIEGAALSLLLFGFGAVALVLGRIAGQYIDRFPGMILVGSLVVMAFALAALWSAHVNYAAVLAVLLWSAGFASVPVALQATVLRTCGHSADLASSAYVVAFQVGIMLGSALGGSLVSSGRLVDLPLYGACIVGSAAVLCACARRTFPLRV